MKNISSLFFATTALMVSTISMHAQTTNGYNNPNPPSYSNKSTMNPTTQTNNSWDSSSNTSSNQNNAWNANNPSTSNWNQNDPRNPANHPSTPTWSNQNNSRNAANSPNNKMSQWSTQSSTSNLPSTNANQPYTQPSNLPTSYNEAREKKFWAMSDDELAQKIRWSIRDDKSLSDLGKSAEVTVKDKNVSLTGTVSSDDEKNRIATIARQVQGVKSVSNNITVKKQ